jgi:hypothetical protein
MFAKVTTPLSMAACFENLFKQLRKRSMRKTKRSTTWETCRTPFALLAHVKQGRLVDVARDRAASAVASSRRLLADLKNLLEA